MRARSTLLVLAVVCFAPRTLLSQELTFLNAVFEKVHKITFSIHGGDLVSEQDLTAGGPNCSPFDLCGFASEVLIDVGGKGHLELGLGASYLRGFSASADSKYRINGGVRSVPTISAYLSRGQFYGGLSFGISDLWNVQAYDSAGNEYAVKGQALEYGPTIGAFQPIPKTPIGVFVEANYRRRQFASLDWSNDTIKSHPREFSLDTWTLGFGFQINVKEAEKEPPGFTGTWVLTRLNGQPLPAVWEAREARTGRSERTEIVTATLDLTDTRYVLRLWERTAFYGDAGLLSVGEPSPEQPVTGTVTTPKEHPELRVLEINDGQTVLVRRAGTEIILRYGGHLLTFSRLGDPLPVIVPEPIKP